MCYSRCGVTWYSMLWYVVLCYVWYSTVQYSTVQYSTVQYSAVQCSTVGFGMVQYSWIELHATVYKVLMVKYFILNCIKQNVWFPLQAYTLCTVAKFL